MATIKAATAKEFLKLTNFKQIGSGHSECTINVHGNAPEHIGEYWHNKVLPIKECYSLIKAAPENCKIWINVGSSTDKSGSSENSYRKRLPIELPRLKRELGFKSF